MIRDGYKKDIYASYVKSIRRDAMEALLRYDWPGNVRALRHAIERPRC